ncbi:MAG: BatD family protein [Bacteroidota bacterium]
MDHSTTYTGSLGRFMGTLLSLVICVFSLAASAQEITFRTKINRPAVAVGERFTISFELANARGKIAPADLGGLNVIFGPSVSESTVFNGKTYSSTITVSYVVVADKEGKLTIGTAKAYTDKGVLETDPVIVTVQKGQAASSQQTQAQAQNVPTPASQKGDIILSVIPSKSKACIGEPIPVTYYLYSRYDRLDLGKYEFPAITGFWCEDLKQESTTWENQMATINGMRYYVAILKRQVIYPQQTGKFQVKPFEMECIVNRSFFSVGAKLNVTSNSPLIEVVPFPAGAPAGFEDISGKYRMESSLSSTEVKANEPITLKIKVSGEGNLKVLSTPKPEFPSDFEVYDPKINDRLKVNASGTNGSREFEYLVIPRYAGDYAIPAYNFTYFDLASKTYKTISTPAYTVKVNRGTGESAGTYSAGNQNQVKVLNKDIRYIHTGKLSENRVSPWSPKHPVFWTVYSVIPMAFAGMALLVSKKRKLKKDQVKLKATVANKVASKHLAEARKALQAKDDNRFYELTFRALYGYLSDKINIPYGDLSRRVIEDRLLARNVEPALVKELLHTLDTCEMARFAPLNESSAAEVYQKASDLINKLEKNLK